MSDRNFVLRVGLEGGQVVVRQLEDIGAKGDAALNRVATAARAEATPGFRAAAAAAGEVDSALQGLAARGGPVASVFASMGKSGLAVAAAMGAVTLGAGLAARAAVDSIRRIDDMADAADRAGVSFEVFQELGFALREAGGEIGDVEAGLTGFLSKIGALRSGLRGGDQVEDSLAILGISKESLLALPSVEAQLALIADGIVRVGDAALQARVAEGLGIEALLPVLKLGAEAMLELMSKAKETGQTLSNDLGKQAGETAGKVEAANARMSAAWDRLAVAMAPAVATILGYMTSIAEKAVDAASGVAQFLDNPYALADAVGASSPVQRAQEALAGAQQTLEFARNQGFDDTGAQQEVEAAQAALDEVVKQQALRDVRETIGEIIQLVQSRVPPSATADGPVSHWREKPRPRKGGRGDAAARAAESFAERARARANWRDDPSAFGAMMQEQEEVSERVTASLLKQSTALGALRTAWEGVDGAQVAYRSGLDVLDSALRGQIRTLEDLGTVLVDILKQWLMMSAQMAAEGKGTFFGNLGNIFSGVLSAFGIGGGSAAAPASTWSGFNWAFGRGRAGGGPAHAGQEFWVGEGGPEKVRFASPATIYSAQASLAMERQMRFAAPQAVLAAAPARFAQAAEPSRGPVQVVIQNNGPPVTAEAREETQGGQSRLMLTLEPVVRQATDRNLSAGRHDRALQGRFGLPVAVQRR